MHKNEETLKKKRGNLGFLFFFLGKETPVPAVDHTHINWEGEESRKTQQQQDSLIEKVFSLENEDKQQDTAHALTLGNSLHVVVLPPQAPLCTHPQRL